MATEEPTGAVWCLVLALGVWNDRIECGFGHCSRPCDQIGIWRSVERPTSHVSHTQSSSIANSAIAHMALYVTIRRRTRSTTRQMRSLQTHAGSNLGSFLSVQVNKVSLLTPLLANPVLAAAGLRVAGVTKAFRENHCAVKRHVHEKKCTWYRLCQSV